MGKIGRPRLLDEGKRREICALVSTGYGLAGAARYVGCSPKTIRREAGRETEFAERLRTAELAAQLEPIRALRKKAVTHWRAAAWLLERIDPEQFAKVETKLLKPEEVGELLDQVHEAVKRALPADLLCEQIVGEIFAAAKKEACLPKRARNVQRALTEAQEFFSRIDAFRSADRRTNKVA